MSGGGGAAQHAPSRDDAVWGVGAEMGRAPRRARQRHTIRRENAATPPCVDTLSFYSSGARWDECVPAAPGLAAPPAAGAAACAPHSAGASARRGCRTALRRCGALTWPMLVPRAPAVVPMLHARSPAETKARLQCSLNPMRTATASCHRCSAELKDPARAAACDVCRCRCGPTARIAAALPARQRRGCVTFAPRCISAGRAPLDADASPSFHSYDCGGRVRASGIQEADACAQCPRVRRAAGVRGSLYICSR